MIILNYQIKSLLKEEKYLKIYWAKDIKTDKNVIVKIFEDFIIDNGFAERFTLWSKRLLELKHPNIVRYIDFFYVENKYGFVIEDFNFSPLWDVFNDMELSMDFIKNVFSRLLSAVNYAHNLGITNGDFECEKLHFDGLNLFIEDFGIKNILFSSPQLNIRNETINHYCCYSPEQFDECDFSPAIDIYSLGSILYALTEGQVPFSEAKNYEELKQIVQGVDYIMPSEGNPFATFIINATQKDIEKRYSSVNEWIRQWEGKEQHPEAKEQNPAGEVFEATPTTENIVEQPDIAKKKVRNKQRYAILVFVSIVILLGAFRVFIKDMFFNPISYNVPLNRYIDNVKIIDHNGRVVDILASAPGEYIFDLKIDIDSGDILHSNVMEFAQGQFSSAQLIDNNIFLIGTNNANKQFFFPVLYIIKNTHHEPYYNTEELGQYIDIISKGGEVFILKQTAKDFIRKDFAVYIEERDFFLNLLKQIKVMDIEDDVQMAKAFVLVNDVFILEIYNFSDRKIDLIALDTSGKMLWNREFASDSISNSVKWKNMSVKDNSLFFITINKNRLGSDLKIRQVGVKGNIIKSFDIRLKVPVRALDNMLVKDDKLIFSVYTDLGYSLLYVIDYKRERLLFKKRFGFIDKVHITDFIFTDDNDLLVAGIVKHGFIADTTNSRNIYLSRLSLDRGEYKEIAFKSKFLISNIQY